MYWIRFRGTAAFIFSACCSSNDSTFLQRTEPSPKVPYILVNVLYGYAYVARLYNGDHLDSAEQSAQVRLTHWGWDKMVAILQTKFSNAFSWRKMYEFWLKFHWSLFLRVQKHGPRASVTTKPRPSASVFVYWVPRAMFFTRHGRPWSNPIIARSLIDFFFHFVHRNLNLIKSYNTLLASPSLLHFGHAPLNSCHFLAFVWLNGFHAFADKLLIGSRSNLADKLIMGSPGLINFSSCFAESLSDSHQIGFNTGGDLHPLMPCYVRALLWTSTIGRHYLG